VKVAVLNQSLKRQSKPHKLIDNREGYIDYSSLRAFTSTNYSLVSPLKVIKDKKFKKAKVWTIECKTIIPLLLQARKSLAMIKNHVNMYNKR
jgi:hypothetical protein